MIRAAIVTFLVFAAIACPALCGTADHHVERDCCPHDGPPTAPPSENPTHEDPCEIAPCFCGGAAVSARDESITICALEVLARLDIDCDLSALVLRSAVSGAVPASPPRPPDAARALPLLI